MNPLVGLYFACSEEEHYEKDGVVRIFDFRPERVKFADSDAISLVANLARLSDEEKTSIRNARSEYNREDKTLPALQKFRSTPAVQRLLQFVRVEKPYFLDRIEPVDLFSYSFVYPAKNNRRVISQSGAFIISGLLEYKGLQVSIGLQRYEEIKIPSRYKPSIINQLSSINISSRTMFPEIEFTSKYIKSRWVVGKTPKAADKVELDDSI